MQLSPAQPREDGSFAYRATVSQVIATPVVVALRIEQERGFYVGAALPEPIALDCGIGQIKLGDWTKMGVLETYSGGAWYRKTISLSAEQARRRLRLDLGNVASTAEVHINGRRAGIRIAPPWKVDINPLVKRGENRIEILVLSALGGHYRTIPTRYPGVLISGLLGPVNLEIEEDKASEISK